MLRSGQADERQIFPQIMLNCRKPFPMFHPAFHQFSLRGEEVSFTPK